MRNKNLQPQIIVSIRPLGQICNSFTSLLHLAHDHLVHINVDNTCEHHEAGDPVEPNSVYIPTTLKVLIYDYPVRRTKPRSPFVTV
jgi:hypothetical protein